MTITKSPHKRSPYKRKRPMRGRKLYEHYGQKVGRSVGSVAYSALKIAKKVKALVNVEEKYFDIQATYTPDYNGAIITLNTPAQGQTDSTRIGDSIKNLHFQARAYLTNAGVAGINAVARIIIFEDPQNKVTTVAQMLDYAGNAYAPFSPKAFDYRFQTKVLYDRTITTGFSTANNPTAVDLVIDVPCGHHTQFNAGTTTINTGAYKMLYISNIAPAGNNQTLAWQSRMFFTDD